MSLFRPQPVGVWPLPAGLLLLPAPKSGADAIAALLLGDQRAEVPQDLSEEWRFYRLAADGDFEAALALLAGDVSPIAQYNRFVLQSGDYHELKKTLAEPLATLLDIPAFTSGLIDHPPSEDGFDGELRALALMVKAAHQIEDGAPLAAIHLLEEAAGAAKEISPVFAAQLLSQLAGLQRSTPGQSAGSAILHYREALELTKNAQLAGIRAELWLNLGIAYQELASDQRGLLVEAIKAYQEALHCGLTLESQPELFAMAQNNLGLAYLSMPMTEASDQLRMAVAVQSFREALKVYDQETHPEMWASVQLNLANALQYLPSSHPEENLIQAVEIYDGLISVRNKALDPLGYARVLANQANALAHLGMFAPALEKVSEAYKLFHWHGEPDLAASSLQLVEQINEKLCQ